MFIIKKANKIMTVDQIDINKSNLTTIVLGYIRYSEDKILSGKIKNHINIVTKIINNLFYHYEKKDIISNIEKFEKELEVKNDSNISNYYTDTIKFLKNYKDHKKIFTYYKSCINKDVTDSLYEFLRKINDIFELKICHLNSERMERILDWPHRKNKHDDYTSLGKKLSDCNEEEKTFLYTEI